MKATGLQKIRILNINHVLPVQTCLVFHSQLLKHPGTKLLEYACTCHRDPYISIQGYTKQNLRDAWHKLLARQLSAGCHRCPHACESTNTIITTMCRRRRGGSLRAHQSQTRPKREPKSTRYKREHVTEGYRPGSPSSCLCPTYTYFTHSCFGHGDKATPGLFTKTLC
jgi:hypothetical protein